MVNKVVLIGNVGKDAEVRYFDNDVAHAKFSLATSENYKDKNDEWQTKTEWHNIIAWRNTAKYAEKWITKGKQVYIEGKLTTRSWDDKDGNKQYITEIVAQSVRLLGRKDDNNEGVGNTASPTPDTKKPEAPVIEDSADDDLPF